MKIFFFPPTSPYNPYIDNIVAGLEKNDVIVVNKGANSKYAKLLSSFKAMLEHTDVYHFNWIENKSAVDTKKNRIVCRAILLWLSLIKQSGGKLAWTMHNKESHFASGDKTFHYSFMHDFISRMDMILVHAKETEEELKNNYGYPVEKICYVPHGSYIAEDVESCPVYMAHDNFVILSFGMVNRYKNIPMLIRAFKALNLDNAELRIYGKCDEKDSDLRHELEELVSSSNNVKYENRFVPDSEVNDIFSESDVVILPYDKQSMINSGVAIKAFSEGRPIIVSSFGAIKELQDKCFVHSYDYNTDDEHFSALKRAIIKVYQSWKLDKSILEEEGRQAFEYSKNDLSWNSICKKIADFYEKIIYGS